MRRSALCLPSAAAHIENAMFVRYYIFLDHPFEEVEKSFLGSRSWLEEIAQGASRRNLRLVGVRGERLRKGVEMSTGQSRLANSSRASLPFTWRATGLRSLFPTFEGELEICRWRPAITQLALSASYTPPLGPLGRVLDRAALHLLAEAMVKDFIDRAGAAIEVSLSRNARATA